MLSSTGRKLEKVGKRKAEPERVQRAKLLERKAIEAYRQLCTALGSSDDVEDRRLALSVLKRLAEDRGVAVPPQRVERQADRDREGPQR